MSSLKRKGGKKQREGKENVKDMIIFLIHFDKTCSRMTNKTIRRENRALRLS
jgi:hypothetical protein